MKKRAREARKDGAREVRDGNGRSARPFPPLPRSGTQVKEVMNGVNRLVIKDEKILLTTDKTRQKNTD